MRLLLSHNLGLDSGLNFRWQYTFLKFGDTVETDCSKQFYNCPEEY